MVGASAFCFAIPTHLGFKAPGPPARLRRGASLLPFSPAFFPSLDKKNQLFAVQPFPWQPHFPILSLHALLTPPASVAGPEAR